MEQIWWKNAVGYQIYPRSFQDSNHDGIGDLNGIREKLAYLKELGIDFIWINPVNESPNVDNGYDISDYQAILTDFGTMAQFDSLLLEAHELGIKVIMDLVINHTSDQHYWFKEAKKGKSNPYRDYYIWKDGKENAAPSDWQSIFGGSVWEYDENSGQYYFHTFAKEQPDLNWENPHLREELYKMVSWWLTKGVDGFRIDAISHIKKADFDLPNTKDPKQPFKRFQNVHGIGAHLIELKKVFDQFGILTVGEASGVTAAEATTWVGKGGYFDMIFSFDHIHLWEEEKKGVDIPQFTAALAQWQEALDDGCGWNALYLENHDVPRSISTLGSDTPGLRVKSGKALALMYLFLQGTPFIYQGQEIGMVNMPFSSLEQLDAVDSRALYHRLVDSGSTPNAALEKVAKTTRDNARTPMQWDDSTYGGFSDTKPWLLVNPNKDEINVKKEQQDEESLWHFYKRLIQLRKSEIALAAGTFTNQLPQDEALFVYTRKTAEQEILVLVNLSAKEAAYTLPQLAGKNWRPLIGNTHQPPFQATGVLEPFVAFAYTVK